MSRSAVAGLQPAVHAKRPWYRDPKLDQYICFWSVPFFYILFVITFVPLSWMMPPRPPDASVEAKVAFMQSPKLLIAATIMVLMMGLAVVANGVYLSQMRRMSVSPVFRVAFMAGSIAGPIVGALFPMFCFALGAFRSGYRPEILTMLYDFGYLAYIGSLGCFALMWAMMGLAIVLDENDILPKWLGYYTIWQYMTEFVGMWVWMWSFGPFAFNGLITFWFTMVIYVPWQVIVYRCIYKAIKNQPEDELANVRVRHQRMLVGSAEALT